MAEQVQQASQDKLAYVVDKGATFIAAFVSELCKLVETPYYDAKKMVALYEGHYTRNLAKAVALRDAARAAGDVHLEEFFRAQAKHFEEMVIAIKDGSKTAAQVIANHDALVSAKIFKLGKYVGPAFDTFKMWTALKESDGKKAGEGALGIGLGAIGGALGGIVGSLVLPGPGTVIGAALGNALASTFAEEINELTGITDIAADLGRRLPDSFWAGIDALIYQGSAKAELSNAGVLNLLLYRIDGALGQQTAGQLFEKAASTPLGREVVGLANQLGRILAPSQQPLSATASHAQLISYTGVIGSALAANPGAFRFDLQPPTLADARSDVAVMISLVTGAPFTLRLVDPAATSPAALALYAQHKQIYEDWLLDRNAIAGGASSLSLRFTDNYIADRIAFQSMLAHRNGEDLGGVVQGPQSIRYFDGRTGTEILVGSNGSQWQHFIFGGEQSEKDLTGQGYDDHIYGGGGADDISGRGGNDHLEGGRGTDTLRGGDGNDTLLGGQGNDLYIWETGGGNDRIVETREDDGLIHGRIQITGTADLNLSDISASGTFLAVDGSDNTWKSLDGKLTLIREGSTWRIAIAGGGSIEIGDSTGAFREGDFGISFGTATEPSPELTITGDLKAVDFDPSEPGEQTHTDQLGNVITEDVAEPDRRDALYGSENADGISGLGGNDFLTAGGGDDIVIGGAGSDIGYGSAGSDRLYADSEIDLDAAIAAGESSPASGAKGDWLNGGDGEDFIIGGVDNDVLFGGEGEDILVGGSGDDVLNADGDYVAASVDWEVVDYGNPFDRVWRPVAVNSIPVGAADVLYGGAGNDFLAGLGGNDVLYGGTGNDSLGGQDHADMLFGGVGDDRITGDHGRPTDDAGVVFAYQGDDSLEGESGNDWLQGEGGDDELFGGTGNDTVFGDASYINGVNGKDYIDGGDGNDELVGGGLADSVFGGAGNDTLLGDASWVVDALHGNDYLDGEAGDDQVRGYSGDDELFGGAGADVLQGDAGNDYLDGEDDNDILFSGDGNDSLFGGSGKDELQGQAGNDELTGEAGNDKLFGQDGDDYLDGGDGLDVAIGGEGKDSIFGGAANDQLAGLAGMDYLDGESGNDELQGGTEADVLHGGDNDDLLYGQAGDDSLDGESGNDQVQGGDGNDGVRGGDGADLVVGDAGADTLYGDAGNDELQGGIGSDSLDGGDGDDILFGFADADTLAGGAGDDILQGDDGADTYVFGRGAGQDLIVNFEQNAATIDVLQFSADVKRTDINAFRQGLDQVFAINGTIDRVTLKDYYKVTRTGIVNGAYVEYFDRRVEQIKFSDGTTWTVPKDSLTATKFGGYTQAALGAGTAARATAADDVLAGSAAGDTLEGDAGDDTYRWGRKSGRDTISDLTGSSTVLMDASIGAADVVLSRSGVNVTLQLRNSPDQLTIAGGATSANGQFKVQFADGTVWNLFDFFHSVSEGNDDVVGTQASDNIDALGGNDTITSGTAGIDTLHGGEGDDTIALWQGTAWGDGGNDSLYADGSNGGATMRGGDGNDTIRSASAFGTNFLYGDAGDDALYSIANDYYYSHDTMFGGTGNDTYYVGGWQADTASENANEGIDTVVASVYWTLGSNLENLILANPGIRGTGNALDNLITGASGNETLFGLGGMDTLNGGAGNDSMDGGTGDDAYLFGRGAGQDTISGELDGYGQDRIIVDASVAKENLRVQRSGSDLLIRIDGTTDQVVVSSYFVNATSIEFVEFADGTIWDASTINGMLPVAPPSGPTTGDDILQGTVGNDNINGLEGNDTIHGYAGDDTLNGGAGADSLVGGTGNDLYLADAGDIIVEADGEGVDSVQSTSDGVVLAANVENLILGIGSTGTGNALANALTGNSANNTLIGAGGNDTLNGGFGADSLVGGSGDDTYIVDDAGDVASELANEGSDTVQSSVQFTLTAEVENLTLTGGTAIGGTGNALNNVLVGNGANNALGGAAGDDTLDGGAGIDTLTGGSGNDVYMVDSTSDVLSEIAGEGTDTVVSSVTYNSLGTNIENVTLTGSAVEATGNAANNVLTGNALDNKLTGGAGLDTLVGGAGNDIYVVTDATDVIVENAGEGTDSVQSSASYVLAANVENLTLTGTATSGTGNSLANVFVGNSAANVFTGGAGDDTYILGAGDSVVELEGDGVDTIQSDVITSLAANVENLTLTGTARVNLTGNDRANVMIGNASNNSISSGANDDKLVGGGGTDTLIGGTGNDYYVVDDSRDGITENANEGNDTVEASFSYTLSGTQLENLVLTGTATTATGNAFANVLIGNALDNTLTGDLGADTMRGGVGNDTYSVNEAGDVVVENAGEGIDLVQSSTTYALTDNVENLTLTGTGVIDGAGNALNNVLTGNTAANQLAGGAGDDTYVVAGADTVVEDANEGTDTVQSSATFVLGANVENLTLTGTGVIDGTGNALNNVLTGNSSANRLTGGAGDDTYVLGAGDTVVENLGEGLDTVQSNVTVSIAAFANVENLVLTGTSAINAAGNADANVITGNAAANNLAGGKGDDIYFAGAGDSIMENANEGYDTVYSDGTISATGAIEHLVLTGQAAINGTTGAGGQILTGNAANNTLDGGADGDTMIGGLGDDTYLVDSANDVIVEAEGEGTDTVRATFSYVAGGGIENITLLGTSALNATGDAGNNTLTGNSAANVLSGGGGNDTFITGGGADTLIGGAGDDTYTWAAGLVIQEFANEGVDTLYSSVNVTLADHLENLVLTGNATTGTGNAGNNTITGNNLANTLNAGVDSVYDQLYGGAGNDTLYGSVGDLLDGGVGDDTYYITGGSNPLNMVKVSVEQNVSGGGIDTVYAECSISLSTNYYTSGSNFIYTGAIENATLTGTGNFNLEGNDETGNGTSNILIGNSGNNKITSTRGADSIDGGAGNDTLWGGTGSTLIGGLGDDRFESNVYASAVTMRGGLGNDYYMVTYSAYTFVENVDEGIDTLEMGVQANYTIAANFENLIITNSGAGTYTGSTAANAITASGTIYGLAGNDTLTATGSIADTLYGGQGDDTYSIGVGDVVVENAGEGNDTVIASFTYTLAGTSIENLTLGGFSAVSGTGNDFSNILTGNSAANVLTGGLGDDTYVVDAADTVVELAGQGTDTVRTAGSYSIASLANVENLELTGAANIVATGNAGNNTLTGNGGANTLDGGLGADTMRGGVGDDTYIVDSSTDVITENVDEGVDTVQSAVNFSLVNTQLEKIVLTGTAQATATGNAFDNTLTGNSVANTLIGGAGNDTYVVNDALDTIVEVFGEGTDTVQSTVSIQLADNVENLVLTGSASINGTGNALKNTLTGNFGANVLAGGADDDTYIVGYGDAVVENVGEGTDTVQVAQAPHTLGANVENGILLQSAGNVSLTGNALANRLTGNEYGDTLDGGAGADTLVGGAGWDTYVVDNEGDVVTEVAVTGTDTVRSSVRFTLTDLLENLVLEGSAHIDGTGNAQANQLTGNTGNNSLVGGGGNDTLSGSAGVDTLVGGLGDDEYVVDNSADVVVESAGEGLDVVKSSASSFVLGANLERLTLTAAGVSGTGNELANMLDSQVAGINTLVGGLGDDTYLIDVSDTVIESADEGIDTVQVNGTFALGVNFENLKLTGTAAANGTGNSLANILTGNDGTNVLTGGAGDDLYVVGAGDSVVEIAGEGFDTVYSSATFALTANVENLTLTGTEAVTGFGNADNNLIVGNTGNNTLDGLGGTDTLVGGLGDDTYTAQSTTIVVESVGEGTDLVISGLDYVLGANLENLQLAGVEAVNGVGNALDNRITGNVLDNLLQGETGDDTLDGAMGADSLMGGLGNDTYDVDSEWDVVIEAAAEGTDTVRSRLDYALGENLENLILGYAATRGTGNALANVITGSAGGNILDGDLGADTLLGGDGNDVYLVDAADIVQERVNEGTDTVVADFSYSLGAELENLTLTGAADVTGTGNALANVIWGNDGSNLLVGGDGDDTLDGGQGADTLDGGNGVDTYVVSDEADLVVETVAGGGDTVLSFIDYTLTTGVENLQLNGSAIRGTGNAAINVIVGNDEANILDGASGADSLIGGFGDDAYVVDSVDDWVAEYQGEGVDEVRTGVALGGLAVNVEILTLTGSAGIAAVGNASDNILRGNAANNTLDGGGGVDIVAGFDGDDTIMNSDGNGALDGGAGADSLTGSAGSELFAGGSGNDTLTLNGGADIVTFNKGDGADVVVTGGGAHNDTLSLGGVQYGELRLAREGSDLVVKIAGTGDAVHLQGWYDSATNQNFSSLQIVVGSSGEYASGSGDVLRDALVKTFDFAQLVAAFDAATVANPEIGDWMPDETVLAAALTMSSDTQAIGGQLAWDYAQVNTVAYTEYVTATTQVSDAAFGSVAQEISLSSQPNVAASSGDGNVEYFPSMAEDAAASPWEEAAMEVYTAENYAIDDGARMTNATSLSLDVSTGEGDSSEWVSSPANRNQGALDTRIGDYEPTFTDDGAGALSRSERMVDHWMAVDSWEGLERALASDAFDNSAEGMELPTMLSHSGRLVTQVADLQSVARLEDVADLKFAKLQG